MGIFVNILIQQENRFYKPKEHLAYYVLSYDGGVKL